MSWIAASAGRWNIPEPFRSVCNLLLVHLVPRRCLINLMTRIRFSSIICHTSNIGWLNRWISYSWWQLRFYFCKLHQWFNYEVTNDKWQMTNDQSPMTSSVYAKWSLFNSVGSRISKFTKYSISYLYCRLLLFCRSHPDPCQCYLILTL